MTLRLTEAEYRAVRARAERLSVPFSEYHRAALLKRRLRKTSLPHVNLQLLAQAHRLGNNLNQLLVLIYTNRAPVGLVATLRAILALLEEVKACLVGLDDS